MPTLWVNNNYGIGPFSNTLIGTNQVYSDVRANHDNGEVYVMTDNPFLRLYKSDDNGSTFTELNVVPPGNIYYSSYSLSVGPLGTFMYVSGGNFPVPGQDKRAFRIDPTTGSSTELTFDPITNFEGRTIASDQYGNIVDGYYSSGNLNYGVSYDQGATFQSPVTVSTGYSHNVMISSKYDDIVVAFSRGGVVYLSVYRNELKVPLRVTTRALKLISCNTAKAVGGVESTGISKVVDRGFVWGTSVNPTIADESVSAGSGTGPFDAVLKYLCSNSVYYVRAYAKDSFGNYFYGKNMRLRTPALSLSLSLSPETLWAPNHKMKTVTATLTYNKRCLVSSAELYKITSNEPDDGLGDGDMPNDIQNADYGTEDYSFSLRAERSGTGTGRIYTVWYKVTEICGKVHYVSATVTVPHDMGRIAAGPDANGNFVELYPNPVVDNVMLNMSFTGKADLEVTVRDLVGKAMFSFRRSNVDNIEKSIDCSRLTPGVYILDIRFGNQKIMRKMIKQ